MRKHAFRALILVAALVALSIPVFSATTTSACDVNSLNTCTGSSTGSGSIDTVTSPMTFTVGTAAFSETALAGEVDYSIPGSLSIALQDMRGDNSGFVVQLLSGGASAPGTNVTIPASDFTVTSSTAVNGFCGISQIGGACEVLTGVLPTSDLSSPETIGVACALTTGAEGYGMYALTEGLNLSITTAQQPLDEIFGTNPKEWSASFTVIVLQGAAGNAVEPCVM
jgi:hypothetical protein